MQRKRHSLLEAGAGTTMGYIVAFVANATVLPAFGLKPSLSDTFWITNVFTVIAVVRSYYVRRLFNYLHLRGIL